MPVYLIRHARAESRSAWEGGDTTRPLTADGLDQARRIAADWAFAPPVAVLSSPRRRCIETVTPLAVRFGLEVGLEPLVEEDTPWEDALAAVTSAADGTVFASHGDVIPAVVDALLRRGMSGGGTGALRKGAMFVLHREGGAFARCEPVAPPGSRPD